MSRRPGGRQLLRTKHKQTFSDHLTDEGHAELHQSDAYLDESLENDISSSEEDNSSSVNSIEEGGYSSNSSELSIGEENNDDHNGDNSVDIYEMQEKVDEFDNVTWTIAPNSNTLPSNAPPNIATVSNANAQSKVIAEKQVESASRLEPTYSSPARHRRDVISAKHGHFSIISRVRRYTENMEGENIMENGDGENEKGGKNNVGQEEKEEEDEQEENSTAEDINIILKFRGIRFVLDSVHDL